MVAVLTNVKPNGDARPYVGFMAERGVGRTQSFALLRTDVAPATFQIGNRRFIDDAIGRAWFAALAKGQIDLSQVKK